MKGVQSPNPRLEAGVSRTLGEKGGRMNTIHYSVIRWLFIFVVLVSAGGCVGSTVIQSSHPLIAREGATETAKVYFIRPDPGLYGVMDMPVSISLAGAELLTLAKGQYTLVQLAAGTTELKANSYTVDGAGSMTKVSSNTQLSFSSGETHYLVFEMVPRPIPLFGRPGGFVFLPRRVSRGSALDAVQGQGLTPVGAAVAEPIAR